MLYNPRGPGMSAITNNIEYLFFKVGDVNRKRRHNRSFSPMRDNTYGKKRRQSMPNTLELKRENFSMVSYLVLFQTYKDIYIYTLFKVSCGFCC